MSDDNKKTDDFEEDINFDDLDDVEVFSDSSDEMESDDLDSELGGLSDKAEEFDVEDAPKSQEDDDEDLSLEEEPELEESEEEPELEDIEEKSGLASEGAEDDLEGLDTESESDDFEFGDDDSSDNEFSLEDGDEFGFGDDDDIELPEGKSSDESEEDLEFADDADIFAEDDATSDSEGADFDFSDSDLDDDGSDLDSLVADDLESLSDEDDLEVVDLETPVDLNELEDSIDNDKNDKSKSDEALSLTDEEKKDMKEIDIHDDKKSGSGKNLILSVAIIGALGAGAYMFAGDEIKSAIGLSDDYADEQPAVSAEERKRLKEERAAKLKARAGSNNGDVKQVKVVEKNTPKQVGAVDPGGLALNLEGADIASSQMVVPDDGEFSLDLGSPEVEVLSDVQDVNTSIEINDSSTFEIAGLNNSAGSGDYVSREKYDELAAKLEELESMHDQSYKALMGLTREFQLSERELNAKIIASDRDRKSDLEKVLKVAAIALTKANTNSSGLEQVSVDFDRKINNFDGKLAEAASDTLSADDVQKLRAVIAEQQEKMNAMAKENEERIKVMEKRLTELSKSSANEKHSSEVPVEKLLNGSDAPINIKIQRASEGSDVVDSKPALVPYKLMGFLPNKVYLFRDGNSYEIEVGSYLPEYGEVTRLNYSTKEVFYGDNKRVNIVY